MLIVTATIRPATPADTQTIAEFNCRLAEESEGKQLDLETVISGVSALFTSATLGRYYVAETDGKVVGQLLVTYEWSDWRNGLFWWIQSVYVTPAHRRSGVFSSLFRKVSNVARDDSSVCGLRLYVEKGNQRAHDTYVALGMSQAGYQVMEVDFT